MTINIIYLFILATILLSFNKKNLPVLILFFSLFLGFLAITYLQPNFADDYWNINSIHKQQNISNYLCYKYMEHTGRILNLILIYFFLKFNSFHLIFSIVNTLFFSLLIITSYFLASNKYNFFIIKKEKSVLLLILFWFCLPVPDETLIWKTGSIVYLWTTVFNLIVLIPYKQLFFSLNKTNSSLCCKNSLIVSFLFFCFCLVSATGSELMFFSIFLTITFILYKSRKSLKKISYFYYLGYFGYLTGGIILLSAPGNYIRLNTHNDTASLINKIKSFSIFSIFTVINTWYILGTILLLILLLKIGNRNIFPKYIKLYLYSTVFIVLIDYFLNSNTYLSLDFFTLNYKSINKVAILSRAFFNFQNLIIFFYMMFSSIKTKIRYFFKEKRTIFLFLALMNFLPMFLLNGFQSRRSTFFFTVFLLIYIISKINLKINWINGKIILVLLIIFLFYDISSEITTSKKLYLSNKKRTENIITQINNDETQIKVNSFNIKPRRYTHIKDINFNINSDRNKWLAEYLKINSISINF